MSGFQQKSAEHCRKAHDKRHGGCRAFYDRLDSCQAAQAGGWRLEAGGWRLEAGGWRLEAGGWRLEAGGWRLEAGGWRLDRIAPEQYRSSFFVRLSSLKRLYRLIAFRHPGSRGYLPPPGVLRRSP